MTSEEPGTTSTEYAYILTLYFPQIETYIKSVGVITDTLRSTESEMFSFLCRREIEKQNNKFGISLKLEDAVPLFYRLVENKCK